MAQLFDARGNEFQGSLDSIGGLTLTDPRAVGATLGAINAELLVDIQGKGNVFFEIRGATSAATYVFEASLDGTNYFSVPARSVAGTVVAAVVSEVYVSSVVSTAAIAAVYAVNCTGWRRVRCRVSAYTSGNAVVSARGTSANYAIITQPQPTTLWITATAAANTIATATLTSSAGLFHYITSISLMRNATAALAGTATLIATTTNLPGSPAWSYGNAMVAGGTQTDLSMTFNNPLKSVAAGTNTTIVMPAAGAAVLNRINVGYYLGA